jgi:glycerol-3-phosphate dehydrogenase (NAD(P)+)
LGGGSWGSAIARVLGEKGLKVSLWEYNASMAAVMQETRECDKLPGVKLPDSVAITSDLAAALDGASVVAFVVPSHTLRSVCDSIAKLLPESQVKSRHFVSLVKGIEERTQLRMTEIIQEVIPGADSENVSVLSGPSHAEEVGRGLATTVVLANPNEETAAALQDIFFAPSLRTYRSVDVVGVELCGAVKNVIAIASGILDGLELGDNARAALMTRGMAEMARLGAKLGGSRESFFGLAGMGDLITTCVSQHSRNRFVGEQVGRGRPLAEVLGEMKMVAEGVRTVSGVMELSKRLNVEMPITAQVHAILFEGQSAREAQGLLMNRAAKNERE